MGCSQSTDSWEDSTAARGDQLKLSHQQQNQRLRSNYRPGETLEFRQNVEAKVVLLGDSGVGKSSLALRFCQGRFSPFHEVTIGAAFLQQTVRLTDGGQLKLHIWDTGGQERFRAMAPLYYRDAAGAIIVYDCSHAPSFESVKFWVSELAQKGPPNCCVVVAGNKCDLPDLQPIDKDSLQALTRVGDDMLHLECSAKTGVNVGLLFESLAEKIYKGFLANPYPYR
eukprot:GHVS01108778.1.p1 GENE.GHVS01108778.1~~GHVS01108778.1.p1  ORF type:complete len:225 (+),score=30.18 GHVS01108778.1:119-793(+)